MVLQQDKLTEVSVAPADDEDLARNQAIKQIKRRRRFQIEAAVILIGMFLLVVIWATSEYHNAGGWPTHGFSQSSGIHDVWNYWIIYPFIGLALLVTGRAWSVYGQRPISEKEIRRGSSAKKPCVEPSGPWDSALSAQLRKGDRATRSTAADTAGTTLGLNTVGTM